MDAVRNVIVRSSIFCKTAHRVELKLGGYIHYGLR